MRTALRTEWLKQVTTKTTLALFVSMLALVVLSVALHGFGFSTIQLSERSNHQATIHYSWMTPPSRSVLRSLAMSTSPMVGGVTSGAAGGRWLSDRRGRCEL